MIPYIEDDVLFFDTDKTTDDFSFEVDEWGAVKVERLNPHSYLGKLESHFDEEVKDNLVEEGLNPNFESCNYVYINNEVVFLDNLMYLGFKTQVK